MIYGEYIFKATSQADDWEATARGWEEIVRCKDCIKKGFCAISRGVRQEHGFCAWAAKEEETIINKATRPDEKDPAPAMPRANANEETVAQLRDNIRELGEERDAMEKEKRYWYEQAKNYERTILRLVTALTREEEE